MVNSKLILSNKIDHVNKVHTQLKKMVNCDPSSEKNCSKFKDVKL